jgi:hypothetical protein
MATTTCGFSSVGSLTGAQKLQFYGPTLIVDIGFDPAHNPASKAPPTPGAKDVGALVDTGASQCCIDATLAMQLRLPIIDQVKVGGVHGSGMMNVHVAQVYIPSLNCLIYGNFIAADLKGAGQPHHAIIGRDFLRGFKMTYDGRTGDVVIEN